MDGRRLADFGFLLITKIKKAALGGLFINNNYKDLITFYLQVELEQRPVEQELPVQLEFETSNL
jgi:hypothetical protein